MLINFREHRRGNPKWTFQRKRQKQGTQEEDKQNKNTTQHVLDTRKMDLIISWHHELHET